MATVKPRLARRLGRARGRTLRQQEARAGLMLVAPTLVVVLVVVVLPVLWSVMLAFQRVRLITLRQAGLFGRFTFQNVIDAVTATEFLTNLRITLIYTVFGTATSIGVGLVAALVVRRPFAGRTLVRASMLLPYVAPVVAATFVWEVMLNPDFGIVNHVGTSVLGWDRAIPFLSQQSGVLNLFGWRVGLPTALIVVILFETWRYFPFAFLFILARLQALPADLEEAARVDGASPLQRFRHIVLPQLGPVIALLVVLRFILTFNKFDDVYLLTGGGAGTEVVSVRVFQFLTARGDVGGSAALALVLAAVLLVLLIVYFRFVGREVEQ